MSAMSAGQEQHSLPWIECMMRLCEQKVSKTNARHILDKVLHANVSPWPRGRLKIYQETDCAYAALGRAQNFQLQLDNIEMFESTTR